MIQRAGLNVYHGGLRGPDRAIQSALTKAALEAFEK